MTSSRPTRFSSSAPTPPSVTRCTFERVLATASQGPAPVRRRRPAPHRDRRGRDTSTCRSSPATDLALLNGLLRLLRDWGQLDRGVHRRLTPKAGTSSTALLDDYPAERRRRDVRHGRSTHLRPRRPHPRRRTEAPDHLLDDGREPDRPGHIHHQRDHQPAPGHRPDRQARVRAVQPHRPAQRDGRARRAAT